jgi:hypothetical protein
MPVFLERMILPALAAVLVIFGVTNPLDLRWEVRVIASLCVLALGYEAALLVHRFNERKAALKAEASQPADPAQSGMAPRFGVYIAAFFFLLGTVSIEKWQSLDWAYRWLGFDVAPRRLVTENPNEVARLRSLLDDIGRTESLEQWNSIPVQCALRVLDKLEQGNQLKILPKTIYVLTSADSTKALLENIRLLLEDAIGKSNQPFDPGWVHPLYRAPSPDYVKDLDAPKLIGHGDTGITIHGRNAAGDFLTEVFSSVFITHQTAELPADPLLAYYHRKYSNFGSYDAIVWIEVGDGYPWNQDGHCWPISLTPPLTHPLIPLRQPG